MPDEEARQPLPWGPLVFAISLLGWAAFFIWFL